MKERYDEGGVMADNFDPFACSDPPEESCSDAGCPVHGWSDDDEDPGAEDD